MIERMEDLERLRWLIAEIERVSQPGQLTKLKGEQVYVLWVTTAMLNSALIQAKAIERLISLDQYDAAWPNERFMWELWLDFRWLMRLPDPFRGAIKLLINANLEFREFAEKSDVAPPADVMKPLNDGLHRYRG